MRDYNEAFQDFSVGAFERQVLAGSLADGLNAYHECCGRWADDPQRIALEWIGKGFTVQTVTYAELARQSAQFAHLLTNRGIGPGDVVAGLLPRIPELFAVVLGAWRVGAIYQPLFTAFGPKAIELRVATDGGSGARLVICDSANRAKLIGVPNCPPVLEVDRSSEDASALAKELEGLPATFEPVTRVGTDGFVMLFTSGTTGRPKGVLYPLSMLLTFAEYMIDGIDLQPSDRYWNVADPGWAYGMAYAVVGPLLLGQTTRMWEAAFAVEGALRIVQEQRITNIAAAPTVYRLLMAAGDAAMAPIAGRIRVASSAGEPLNPELVRWAERTLRCPLRDHYGQTEMAMLVNNHHALAHPIKPGSAGLPAPGFHLEILDDNLHPVAPGTPGILAVDRTRSPMFMFKGYWNNETPSFRGPWYLTGDSMTRDADGFYFFVGRSDDVITSSAYRIGPFDVESAIMELPAVAEVAVVGKPDPDRTEIVKAFVVLRIGEQASPALTEAIQQHVRMRVGAHAYPREVDYLDELPKTPSGKVQRFLLRQRG
ncbi:MAG: AMP-binding protein [Burkholderiales bacterium]